MYRLSILFFALLPFLVSACKITPDNETTTDTHGGTTIGTPGGRVFAPNSGAYVIIQPETFQVETTVSLNDLVVDVPLEVQASDVVEITPATAAVSKPVTLVIPYSGGGFDPQDLQIFWSNDPNAPIESWQAIDSMVDPIQNVVSAHIGQFGYFVVGIADSSETGTTDDTADDTSTGTDTATDTDTTTATTTDTVTETATESGTDGTDTVDTESDTVTDTMETGSDSTTETDTVNLLDYCATAPCGEHGTCTNLPSGYTCSCAAGYAGTNCDYCDSAYQDNDGDGICTPNCSSLVLDCGTYGTCDDSSGTAVCACANGYAGASCSECAAGYQDNDNNGTCSNDCATSGLSCAANSACDDSTGTAVCLCTAGYSGATCSACASGYQDNDNNGSCTPNCASASLACGANGDCDDSTGNAFCDCDAGYAGTTCTDCAAGYQDRDNDGVCLPTCDQLGWTCSGNGTCSDLSGEAVCNCNVGYTPDGAGGCFVSGNTCLESIALSVGTYPVSGSVTGTTVGAGSSYEASCVTSTSSEVVYSFTLTETSSVTFSTGGSTFDTVLYLRSDCDDSADEIACDDDGDGGLQSYIETVLDPGTYSVFVDGFGSNDGDYILTYTMESVDPCIPNPCTTPGQTTCVGTYPSYTCECDTGWIADGAGGCVVDTGEGQTCDMAYVLSTSSLPATGSVSGSTTGAGFDYEASCGYSSSSNGAASEEMVYTFTVAEEVQAMFSTEGSSYDSVLHVRTDCDDYTSEIACSDDIASGIYQSRVELNLDPGTYSVFVDGYLDSVYGQSGDYTLSYSLTPNPCTSNPCGANATGCTPSSDWSSFTCQCAAGYIVDPISGVCVLDTGVSGSTCANPTVLPIISVPGSATFSGSSDGAGEDYTSDSCGGAGNDIVYSFTVTETVNAVFNTDGSDYDTVLHVRSDCDNDASQLGCDDDGGTSVQSNLELTLSPGTYSVFLDAFGSGNYGNYVLTITLSTP